MRASPSMIVVVLLALFAAAVSGCGGKSSKPAAKPPPPPPTQTGPSRAELLAQHEQDYETCKDQIGDFLNAMEDLNSRLDIGLSFADYGTKVGDAKVQHDRLLPLKELGVRCIGVAAAIEGALNRYISAYNIWNRCINDLNCSTDSIKPQLQKEWLRASTRMENAKGALENIRKRGDQ